MKTSTQLLAVITLVASTFFAAGCGSSPKKADTTQAQTAPTQQEQQTPETPASADLGAGSSGRGR